MLRVIHSNRVRPDRGPERKGGVTIYAQKKSVGGEKKKRALDERGVNHLKGKCARVNLRSGKWGKKKIVACPRSGARRLWWRHVACRNRRFTAGNPGLVRNDWTRAEVRALFELPFPELMFEAARVHRLHFDPSEVQISTLLSIKTGGCPEDCAYCPQAARYDTGVKAEKLMALDAVLAEARAAKAGGASRFCMGAAWREPKDRDVENVCAMVEGVKALGLETCATLGMLTPSRRGG